jgi:hypothetical protein
VNVRSNGPAILIALGVLRALFPVQVCTLNGRFPHEILWTPLQPQHWHCSRVDDFPMPLIGITVVQAGILILVGVGWWARPAIERWIAVREKH